MCDIQATQAYRLRRQSVKKTSDRQNQTGEAITMPKAKDNPDLSKRQIDWEAINREYRAGLLSVREIAKMFGITHTAIQKRAKNFPDQWKRDLTQKIQAEVARKLVTDSVTTAGDEDSIVAEASARALSIIKKHRKCLARLAELEAKLLAELHDNPTKLWIGQYMGKIITKEVPIPLPCAFAI